MTKAGVTRAEFEELVERHHRDLVRLAYAMCRDRELAQDAAQACWQAALQHGSEIRGRSSCRAATRLAAARARSFARGLDPSPMQDPKPGAGLVTRLTTSLRNDDVGGLAAEIAFRFLFAVFPFGLFVAALGSFIAASFQVENPAADILAGLGDNLPPSIGDSLRPELERLLATARPDLLSVGALGALWAATGGTNALIKGIHRAYDLPETRPFLLRYVISIALTIVAAVGTFAAFVTVIGGATVTEVAAQRLGLGAQATEIVGLARWPLVFLGMTGVVALLYRYGPNVVVPWRWVMAGSAVFAAGWLGATALLGLYVSNVADYGATYGSLAGVIVLMIWFYLTGALLILGAEIAAALAWQRSADSVHPRHEEEVAGAAIDHATKTAARGMSGAPPRAAPDKLSRPGA